MFLVPAVFLFFVLVQCCSANKTICLQRMTSWLQSYLSHSVTKNQSGCKGGHRLILLTGKNQRAGSCCESLKHIERENKRKLKTTDQMK